jgi:hypothetical protein
LHVRRSILPVVAAVFLGLVGAGCGSQPEENQAAPATATAAATTAAATAAATTPTPDASTPDAKTIIVRVAGGKVTPRSGRVSVARGERVRLIVTSDVADEVHVHSYDAELRLTAGEPGRLEFIADKSGLFDVETHETKLILFQLLVR